MIIIQAIYTHCPWRKIKYASMDKTNDVSRRFVFFNVLMYSFIHWIIVFSLERGPIVIVIELQLNLYLPLKGAPITAWVASSIPVHVEVYSIQFYIMIKFVSDSQEVCNYLQGTLASSNIKYNRHNMTNNC